MDKHFSKTSICLCALTVIVAVICTMLFVKINSIETDINQMKDDMFGTHSQKVLGSEARAINSESATIISAGMENTSEYDNIMVMDNSDVEAAINPYEGKVKVCFTFDDGPSSNTDNILDILDSYDVKATFFVNGKEGFDAQYKRIVEEGHAIGMHSFSHDYKDVYGSLDMFADDLYEIQTLIQEKTGVDTKLYRFPGGSSNTVSSISMTKCIEYLNAKGIEYYDWNVAAQDALPGGMTTAEIVSNVMDTINVGGVDTYMVLFHDAQDKSTTVEALPIIIEKLLAMDDVVIVAIDDNITPVQHVVVQ